jgi:carbon monoxide dehydrogenase subunit G
MHFEQTVEVDTDTKTVWKFLWEVERLARCLPGCQEVEEIEPQKKYTVVVEERIGPFKAKFKMDVEVLDFDLESRVRIQAVGKDPKLGASTRAELDVQIQGLGPAKTALNVTADIQVVGKIASLGQVAIKRKAQDIVTRFANAIATELASEPVD